MSNKEKIGYFFEQINDDTCKTYIFGPKGGNNVAIVDPKLDYIENYENLLKERGLNLKLVIDTHTHADHLSGAAFLKEKYDAELVMGEKAPAQCVDTRVSEDMQLDFEGIPMRFLFTPGHTKDAMSVILPGKILTGDALFLDGGGAGRDDLPGGSAEAHFRTIQKLKSLPPNLVVYPAHDYRNKEPSPLSQQIDTNPHMQYDKKEDFISYIEDLRLGPAEWMKDVLDANYDCTKSPDAAWVPKDSPACEVMGTIKLDPEVEEIIPKNISVKNLKSKLKKDNLLLLDVRSKTEFEKGKLDGIEGSINIPLTAIANDVKQLDPHKEKEVCVICGSGKRSNVAAKILENYGFQDIKVLEGGLRAYYDMNPPKD